MVDVDHVVVALVHMHARLGRYLAIDRITTRNLFHVSLVREIQALAIDVNGPVGMEVGRLRGRNPQEARSSESENAECDAGPQSFSHYLPPFRSRSSR